MQINLLKAKLHQARVTHTELKYEGSCAIDSGLMAQSGMLEFEQVQIYNIENGERFTTYAIKAEKGSGIISLNGAAAHKANVGDRIIICAYAQYGSEELRTYRPLLIYLNAQNTISRVGHSIVEQVA